MFGIVISKLFIDGYYLFEKKFCILSGIMCRDIFYKYIESDELVEYGCMQIVLLIMDKGLIISRVCVYLFINRDFMFVIDEGCRQLGEMIINVGSIEDVFNYVFVGLSFGKIELIVEVREKIFGQIF